MGCPCESSGGVPDASEAMILPSRSPQARPSASIFTPGVLASNRRAISLKALIVCGSVSVCQTRTTLSCDRAEPDEPMPAPAVTAAAARTRTMRDAIVICFLHRDCCFLPGEAPHVRPVFLQHLHRNEGGCALHMRR